MFRRLTMLFNPFTRTAVIAFAWAHRRTIMRWGRSLYAELRRPGPIAPRRLQTIAKVLWEITNVEQLASARQLREVRLDGDVVVVDAAKSWSGTHRLVDVLDGIDGVSAVVDVSGQPLAGSIDTSAR